MLAKTLLKNSNIASWRVFANPLLVAARNHLRFSGHQGRGGQHQHERCCKSTQLGDALKDGKKIIVCTTQTFSFALQAARELVATEGTESPS